MRKLIIIGIVFLIIGVMGCTNLVEERTYPDIDQSYPAITIHELKEAEANSGNLNVEGYVVKTYSCPPCPKGALCKTCMGDNIVISENSNMLETYNLTTNELIIFVENSKQFEIGKKYTFSIEILDYKTTGEPVNDIKLVGYNLIEPQKGQIPKGDKDKYLSQYCEKDNDCALETELWPEMDCSHNCKGEECTEDLRLCNAYYKFSKGNIEAKVQCARNEPCREPREIKCVNNQCLVKEEIPEERECATEQDCIDSGKCSVGLECTCYQNRCYAGLVAEEECATDLDCGTGGCSGQICGTKDKVKDIVTTCEWKEEYGCYKETGCSCINGKCQWKETSEFLDCMETAKSSTEVIV